VTAVPSSERNSPREAPIASQIRFDDTAARHIEQLYRTPDVVAQRQQVLRALDPRPGERVLDVGSGPALLVEELAERVRPGGRVHGIDLSASMVALARARLAEQPHRERIVLQVADATRLPFPAAAFDAVVSTQVYEYVADLPTALAELRRVLRPGGRALILDTDWDSIVWHSADPARMEQVLAAWAGHCLHPHLPRALPPLLRAAGLRLEHVAVVPLLNPAFDPDTYSAGIISTIQRYAARHGVSSDQADAWAEDLRQRGARGDYFFSLNRYLFLARHPGDHAPSP